MTGKRLFGMFIYCAPSAQRNLFIFSAFACRRTPLSKIPEPLGAKMTKFILNCLNLINKLPLGALRCRAPKVQGNKIRLQACLIPLRSLLFVAVIIAAILHRRHLLFRGVSNIIFPDRGSAIDIIYNICLWVVRVATHCSSMNLGGGGGGAEGPGNMLHIILHHFSLACPLDNVQS